MKKKLVRKVYQYVAVFEPDEEFGGFTATIPALPGCISEGDTFEEAMANIQEAASLYLEDIQPAAKKYVSKNIVIAPVEVTV